MPKPFTSISVRKKTMPKLRRLFRLRFPRLGIAEALDLWVEEELGIVDSRKSQTTTSSQAKDIATRMPGVPASTPALPPVAAKAQEQSRAGAEPSPAKAGHNR